MNIVEFIYSLQKVNVTVACVSMSFKKYDS